MIETNTPSIPGTQTSQPASTGSPNISVVIPVKDEKETLRPLYEKICETLEPIDTFEILFVDDGSEDGSFSVLQEIFKHDERVKVFRFRINFGKSAALAAGFQHARGKIVVTIDSDLQDDPAEIPRLLETLQDGYDLVSGWKHNRKDSISKRILSRIFNAVVARSSGIPLHDFNCGLKCYRREVLEQVHLYGEMHRFLPVMAGWFGFRIGEVKITHHPRRSGKSKYGKERLVKGFLDFGTIMFFSHYVQRPAHLFGRIGLTLMALSVVLLLVSTLAFGSSFPLMGGILLTLGLVSGLISFQCFSLGLMAELLTFLHRREEPSYYIYERLER